MIIWRPRSSMRLSQLTHAFWKNICAALQLIVSIWRYGMLSKVTSKFINFAVSAFPWLCCFMNSCWEVWMVSNVRSRFCYFHSEDRWCWLQGPLKISNVSVICRISINIYTSKFDFFNISGKCYMHTGHMHVCVSGVKKCCFSVNFAYVVNEWLLWCK